MKYLYMFNIQYISVRLRIIMQFLVKIDIIEIPDSRSSEM